MTIGSLFKKPITRPINGVVKVDQQDDDTIRQELDEYVVTRELDTHLNRFFTSYLKAIDEPKDPTIAAWMGVWVSGFFGSGKSHFIKILSYLLANREVKDPNGIGSKKASDFFDSKIKDPFLLAEVKRAVAGDTDVILFNIDSKADSKDGRDAILSVFVRVFNEMRGYSGDSPHIAELERYLDEKGLLQRFHQAFKAATSGDDWVQERDAYLLRSDEMIAALANTLGKSTNAAKEWFEKSENSYTQTIEKFAKSVSEYLDKRGPEHRVIFVIDEVGQFIGTDTHLMLNLQTIVEDLGRLCKGRAWVIVTSQEDIDAVVGEIRGTKANDFSKIQGRFHTRLSLSSVRTDEVIQERLLEKTNKATEVLEDVFQDKGDILKHQLSFTASSSLLKSYTDGADFARNYPFVPYQFPLLQAVFESIRKVGATGLHLSRGERSLLDAFQSSAVSLANKEIGALAPLYSFYPSIENFLDTTVKKTIQQAGDNPALQAIDLKILEVLFLIRYIDNVIKPSIDNLVTLCIDQLDADRLELKRKIEDSLQRLEKETLINRNGEYYYFLTNEERDVSREIKTVDLSGSEENRFLSELIYEEVLKGENKHRYKPNKRDYGFDRFCDGHPLGRVGQDLRMDVVSPFADDYSLFNSAKCIGYSSEEGGRILIKLGDTKDLERELRTYLQTKKFIERKNDASAPETLKKILRERGDQNQERKTRLVTTIESLIGQGDFYALGQSLTPQSIQARSAIAEAQDYLIKNIFTKLEYLRDLHDDPQREIRATLTSDDIGQYSLQLNIEGGNVQALREIKSFIDLSTTKNHRIPLDQLVERFAGRPYGWPEWEIVLLLAKLVMAGEITLMMEGATLTPREAIEPLTRAVRWRQLTILKRKAVEVADLDKARRLGQALFNVIGPESEEGLFSFLREHIQNWHEELVRFEALAEAGSYPGGTEIAEGLRATRGLLSIQGSFEFFQSFNRNETDLRDLIDQMHDLKGFYDSQRPIWDKLRRAASGSFRDNRQFLELDPEVRRALTRMDEILTAKAPYGILHETERLVALVDAANQSLLAERRAAATALVDGKITKVNAELQNSQLDGETSNHALFPLQQIKKRIGEEESVQKIFFEQNQNAEEALERALELIDSKRPGNKGDAGSNTPIRYVRAAVFSKTYLETQADVDDYLNTLRDELEKILKEKVRIRLQ